MELLFALFVLAHGLIYSLYNVSNDDPKWPFSYEKSWSKKFFGKNTKQIGRLLSTLTIFLFIASAFSITFLFADQSAWQALLVSASISGLITQILFWQNQLILGVLINFVLIYLVASGSLAF